MSPGCKKRREKRLEKEIGDGKKTFSNLNITTTATNRSNPRGNQFNTGAFKNSCFLTAAAALAV